MKLAADFRGTARECLKGKWGIAVLAGILASMLGAVESGGPELNFEFENGMLRTDLQIAGQTVLSSDGGQTFLPVLAGVGAFLLVATLVAAVAFLILGGIVEVGYSRFNLDLVDRREEAEVGTLFRYFTHWRTAACTRLLTTVYVFLWSLLLVVPGIVAGYSYAMTGYILAENPQMSATDAIERSKELMRGNRWRLFCLDFSFIGWAILSGLLTFGIGSLWLIPYQQAAKATFYREITGGSESHSAPEAFDTW